MRKIQDLAYILGCLRDGSLPKVSNNKFEVTLAMDWNEEWLKEVVVRKASNALEIPVSRVRIYRIVDRKSKIPYFRVKVYSKEIYRKLSHFYQPGKQENWKTPELIKSLPLKYQVEYVRGFYDAEGGTRDVRKYLEGKTKTIQAWISIRCKHGGIRNEPLEFIKGVLEKFKIRSSIRDNDELTITGKENVLKFFKVFTPLHPEKRKMFKRITCFLWARLCRSMNGLTTPSLSQAGTQ